MKIILFQAVENLGRPGDIVQVKSGYYRNYLGPRGFADEATAGNLKRLAQKRKQLEQQAQTELEQAQQRAETMRGLEIEFAMRADEKDQLYGAVHVGEIADGLKEKGYEVARRDIFLGSPIKALGEHELEVRLHPSVTTTIKVIVKKSDA